MKPFEIDPHHLAQLCLEHLGNHADGLKLRWHQQEWYLWTGQTYRHLSEDELNAQLVQAIKAEFEAHTNGKKPLVTRRLLADVRHALQSLIMVPSDLAMPCWLGREAPWPADETLACKSGLFHLPALAEGREEKLALTPSFFSTSALDFEIRLDAPSPTRWLAFLKQLWPNDAQSVKALQEWFGYCLTQDTSQQRIMMLIGPPRSGKSTIARVLTSIVGNDNVARPLFSSLQCHFGLQALLGKTLAIVPDVRLKGLTEIVVERLLNISGEDSLTVDRKYQPPVVVKLPTRLMLISNELPRFNEALISRMIFLKLTEGFLGRENLRLIDELPSERSGILLWAIAGRKRLQERGHFVQPKSAKKMLKGLSSRHAEP